VRAALQHVVEQIDGGVAEVGGVVACRTCNRDDRADDGTTSRQAVSGRINRLQALMPVNFGATRVVAALSWAARP
jgi:hypothetical protein